MRQVGDSFIGILPAAGRGTRLYPFRYPKELLPVVYEREQGDQVQPILSIEYSLQAMSRSGIRRCFLIISPWKTELFRVLGNSSSGVLLSYLCQETAAGTAHAINAASEWVQDHRVCLSLPDTIFYPADSLEQVCKRLLVENLDLVLGVFPSSDPTQFGPVAFDETDNVRAVFDKPASTDIANTWGIAAWSSQFTSFLKNRALIHRNSESSLEIGTIFNEAVEGGLQVKAEYFAEGRFIDIGKKQSISNLLVKRYSKTN